MDDITFLYHGTSGWMSIEHGIM